jgi:N-acetylmuramoyl-L-alanine amidase
MLSKSFILLLSAFILASCRSELPLHQKIIVLDPGHGDTAETDHYRIGPTGEREEWINLRVAIKLQQLLEKSGAAVLLTRTEDIHIELADRAKLAVDNNADLFLSIHHNAIADTAANFPIIYYHGNASENRASVLFANIVAHHIKQDLFEGDGPAVVASDHTIFPTAGTAVLRHSYGIPGIISEASFFTNPAEEEQLKDPGYNQLEAEALHRAVLDYVASESLPIHEKYSLFKLPPFPVFQAAERMSPEGFLWRENFEEARSLMDSEEHADWEKAYELASESVRAFADSPAAQKAHLIRASVLHRLGRLEKARIARLRAQEFYVDIK